MSDTSISNSRINNKRRIHEIDDTIEQLSHEVKKLNSFVFKSEFECCLMTAKLKREKVKALTAIAKSQVILADMEIMIAESDLFADLQRLKNSKRMKLDIEKGNSHRDSSSTHDKSASTQTKSMKSILVQTTQSMFDQKKKRKTSSSKPKSPVDISSDETLLIEKLPEHTGTVIQNAHLSQTIQVLNKPQSTNNSDSEISLSSSIKAEFNNPYSKDTENKTHKKSETAKKDNSKIKSSNVTQRSETPSITTKTVAEINKSVSTSSNNSKDKSLHLVSTPKSRQKHRMEPYKSDRKKAASTSTFVPVRHHLPIMISQVTSQAPMVTTSSLTPCFYVNPVVTQANIPQTQSMNNRNFSFYGTQ